ncbi:ROK family protein [Streptomyces sp. NPDC059168]|uniref:ROK family transcriptional regulator n=1 Tax=Streptomyces sp. NPDC059168 TaxID=3346753 RepID=UPI003697FCB6
MSGFTRVPSDGRERLAARQSTMRSHNLALVMHHISQQGPTSRARIASALGLTKATVSALADELLRAALLVELAPEPGPGVGRRGQPLALNPQGPSGIGLEINVDHVTVCLMDLTGTVRHEDVLRADNRGRSPRRVLADSAPLVRRALELARGDGLDVMGLEVAVPGIVASDTGRLLRAPNLGWSDVGLGVLLREVLELPGLPVGVGNEADLAALGELWFGGGAEWGDFIHVTGEVGVGAGLVFGNRLFRGAHGYAGEFGHMTVQRRGPLCRCGARGCLEVFAGQEAILRAAGLAHVPGTRHGGPPGSVPALRMLVHQGEARALQAVEAAGEKLGVALSGLVNVLDPDTVVLGGLYAVLAPWLVRPLTRELEHRLVVEREMETLVRVSRLPGDAAARGAAGAVVRRLIAEPATSRGPQGPPRGGPTAD